MAWFVNHPERLYLDLGGVQAAAGQLEQWGAVTSSERDALVFRSASTALRLIETTDYKDAADFCAEFAATMEVETNDTKSY